MDKMRDRADDLAAILSPNPESDSADERVWDEVVEAAMHARQQLAERLRLLEGEGVDPLLTLLGEAHHRKLAAEREIRLLITYGREFVWPRPYRLIDLGQAVGLSTSGIRIAYRAEDVDAVAQAVGRTHQGNPVISESPGGGEHE